jgi:hypothetical protein
MSVVPQKPGACCVLRTKTIHSQRYFGQTCYVEMHHAVNMALPHEAHAPILTNLQKNA